MSKVSPHPGIVGEPEVFSECHEDPAPHSHTAAETLDNIRLPWIRILDNGVQVWSGVRIEDSGVRSQGEEESWWGQCVAGAECLAPPLWVTCPLHCLHLSQLGGAAAPGRGKNNQTVFLFFFLLSPTCYFFFG